MSATKEWCESKGLVYLTFWRDPKAEVYLVIGKDIYYFHTMFWPAMLQAAEYNVPKKVAVHGFLTVNGAKMSKSRGTFISPRTFAKHIDPIYLRYYLACKLSGGIDDMDFNYEDFVSRVNSDLIGKITNVASRGAQMLGRIDGTLGTLDAEGKDLVLAAQARAKTIADAFESFNFAKAMIEIRSIADEANKYFDTYEPWKLVKENPERVRVILTTILNQFRLMTIYLKPVLPEYAAKVAALFKEGEYTWDSHEKILEKTKIGEYVHLLQRLDPKKMEDLKQESLAEAAAAKPSGKGAMEAKVTTGTTQGFEALAPEIEITDFQKIDLRVAKIVSAEAVEGSDKLLRLTLDLGFAQRQVFSGIKSAYAPESLVGKQTIVVANLKPRKMKFGMSEGMVLAAGPGGKDIFLLNPDQGATPGLRVT
jgi:methionyl-tRNA synthetase